MTKHKIAIVGAACRLPGGVASLDALWDVLVSGRDVVTEIPADRFDVPGFLHPQRTAPGRTCTFAAGVLDGVGDFDFSFFGISKKEAEYMDPQQRLLLELAWEALEDAHIPPPAWPVRTPPYSSAPRPWTPACSAPTTPASSAPIP
jgi:acyl transferase domain-containing protein